MILDFLKSRRSVRRFKPERPPREVIDRLIDAAVSAPSASNKQPWRFVIVTDPAVIRRMAADVRAAVERIAPHVEPDYEPAFRAYGDYFTRFQEAPVVIVPLYRSLTLLSNMVDAGLGQDDRAAIQLMEENSGLIGASLAIQNLLLMAHDQGLGASGMTGPLVALGALRQALEVPPSWQIAALIPVGYPAEAPAATPRKPVESVVRWIE
ncbi:MAG: nitroreductase family protein [Elusimicrobia bacterium]|nr:nitroreductase family protein [Elusimicrobiota bacterium]